MLQVYKVSKNYSKRTFKKKHTIITENRYPKFVLKENVI